LADITGVWTLICVGGGICCPSALALTNCWRVYCLVQNCCKPICHTTKIYDLCNNLCQTVWVC